MPYPYEFKDARYHGDIIASYEKNSARGVLYLLTIKWADDVDVKYPQGHDEFAWVVPQYEFESIIGEGYARELRKLIESEAPVEVFPYYGAIMTEGGKTFGWIISRNQYPVYDN